MKRTAHSNNDSGSIGAQSKESRMLPITGKIKDRPRMMRGQVSGRKSFKFLSPTRRWEMIVVPFMPPSTRASRAHFIPVFSRQAISLE